LLGNKESLGLCVVCGLLLLGDTNGGPLDVALLLGSGCGNGLGLSPELLNLLLIFIGIFIFPRSRCRGLDLLLLLWRSKENGLAGTGRNWEGSNGSKGRSTLSPSSLKDGLGMRGLLVGLGLGSSAYPLGLRLLLLLLNELLLGLILELLLLLLLLGWAKIELLTKGGAGLDGAVECHGPRSGPTQLN
jgi:hypothetical protein